MTTQITKTVHPVQVLQYEITYEGADYVYGDAVDLQGAIQVKGQRIEKPPNAIVINNTEKVCPAYGIGDKIYAVSQNGGATWIDINIDARQAEDYGETPPATCSSLRPNVLKAEYSAAGIKGQKGETGVTAKGEKGEEGDKASTSDKGEKGTTPCSAGDKGAQGDDGDAGPDGKGAAGAPGATGDDVDLGDSPVVQVDNVDFGARLIGVCRNGEWKYVYIFASDPI